MKLLKKSLGLCLAAVMSLSCLPLVSAEEAELNNVSLNKYVWANSYYSADMNPTLVVDGNISTEWANGSISQKPVEGGQCYWAVDLLKSYPISEIRFYVRSGDGIDWARENFKIEISEDSEFTSAETVYETVPAVSYGEEHVVKLDVPKTARYVRFIKMDNGEGGFGLAEVAVMSAKENFVDVARGKTTEAPYSFDGHGSELVVDGMPAGDWANRFLGANVSYLDIDLGEDYQKYDLEEIVYRPGGNNFDDTANSNFRIIMSSNKAFPQDSTTVEVYRNTAGEDQPVAEELRIDISEAMQLQTGAAKTFRYIRITALATGQQKSISEISVLGRKLAGEGANVAKGKTVTSSSAHAWYPNTAAVDGLFVPEGVDGNRWLTDGTDKNRPWIVVDLGAEYRLNSLVFQMKGSSSDPAIDPVSYQNFQVEIAKAAEDVLAGTLKDSKAVYVTPQEATVTGRISVSLEGDEGVCRYIKIQSLTDIPGDQWQQFGVAELAAYSTDLPYTPSDSIEFLTSEADATPVGTVPESNAFAVRFKGANSGNEVKNVTLIQAGYTDGNLASVKLYTMSIPAGVSALPMVQSVSTADAEGDSFRFYVWEDGTLQPLYQPGEISRAV